VLHTGAMPLTPNMTVLQALATAGFTQFANTKGIYVLRMLNGKQQKLPFNYKQVVKGEAIDENIVLKPGDTIVVPQGNHDQTPTNDVVAAASSGVGLCVGAIRLRAAAKRG